MKLYETLAKNKELYMRVNKQNFYSLKDILNQFKGVILDVGCGNLTSRFDFKIDGYVGIDIVRSDSTSVIGDLQHLPFKSECFDNSVCNMVLEHVNQPKQVLNEIYRVLRPRGKLYVCVPFLEQIHSDPYDFQRFTDQGLKSIVESVGFKIEWIYGNYGVIDTIEYLLFGAIVWKIKESAYKKLTQSVYIVTLLFAFIFMKVLGFCFRNIQKTDCHHATFFRLLASKPSNYEIIEGI